MREQASALAAGASQIAGTGGTLPADVVRAREATDAFAAWLETEARSKHGPSGVGIEHYDWYL